MEKNILQKPSSKSTYRHVQNAPKHLQIIQINHTKEHKHKGSTNIIQNATADQDKQKEIRNPTEMLLPKYATESAVSGSLNNPNCNPRASHKPTLLKV
jgi:hypothetical protein